MSVSKQNAHDSFELQWRRRFERFAASGGEHSISGWSARGLATRFEAFQTLYRSMDLPRAAWVLDLGCGPGTYSRWIAELGKHVVGLDYSLPSLVQARLRDGDREERPRYTQGEAYHLPFRSRVFDAVVCVGVLQALSGAGPALSEMTRVLKEDGLLVVDGLNACGLTVPAEWVHRLGTSGHKVVRYRPLALRRRVRKLGYRHLHLCPVLMSPACPESLARIIRRAGIGALPLAHSFFLLGRKSSVPETPGSIEVMRPSPKDL